MDKQTEYQVIDKVLDGDVQAFSVLINEYKDMVFTLSKKLLNNNYDAEELAQDVFIKAFEKLSQFDKKSKFSTWLYTITYRTGLNILKKKKVKSEELIEGYNEISSGDSNPLAIITKEETAQKVRNSIAKLKPEDRYIIQLYYYEEMSVKEIAQIIGHSETNVKSKLFRTRKRLEDILKSQQ